MPWQCLLTEQDAVTDFLFCHGSARMEHGFYLLEQMQESLSNRIF